MVVERPIIPVFDLGPISRFTYNFKVAPYCLALPSLAFNYSLPDSVAEKLLLQTSKSFISQQSGIQMTSIFVAMTT